MNKTLLAMLLPALFPLYIVEGGGGGDSATGGATGGGGATTTGGGDQATTTTTSGADKTTEAPSLRDDLDARLELAEKGDESTDLSDAARKLAAARKGVAAKAVEPADKTKVVGTETKVDDKTKTDTTAVEAPAHWPAADREMFSKQSPEGKRWLLGRHRALEADYTRRVQAIQPVMRLKETVDEVFKPLKDEMNLQGIDESTAIRQLVAAHLKMRADPVAGIKWLAENYGADLKAVVEGKSADPAADSPAVTAMRNELAELRKWRESLTTSQRTEQHNATLTQVTQFAEEKDAQGQPLRPYFDEVAKDVSRLIRGARAQNETLSLQDAYDQAIHANPATRAKVLAANDAKRRAEEEAERKRKADSARKAGFNVSGEGSATTVVGTTTTLRDSLEKAWDSQAGARV